MKPADDPFLPLSGCADGEIRSNADSSDFASLSRKPVAAPVLEPAPATPAQPVIGQFAGFDLLDQPVVTGIPTLPGERLAARSCVALRRSDIGRAVVLMFEGGDPRSPLIMGVLQAQTPQHDMPAHATQVLVDNERQLIEAEREVVLRCGDASITLTRAGKVIIKGHYILSRSTGANKIKGAAIDIN